MAATAVLAVALPTAALAANPASSAFTVVNGSIRTATGIPTPSSGTQATLWSNASTAQITVSGAGRLEIGAIGDFCGGWPKIRVVADGNPAGDLFIVDAKRYGSYPVGPRLSSGPHKVLIKFVNDTTANGCDRNVHIGSVRVVPDSAAGPTTAPGAGTAEPTTTTTAKPSTRPRTTTSPPTATPPTTTPPTSTSKPPAPADGVAGPDNTGVPAGTKLTVHNGDLTVTKPGTVIDAMDVRGFLDIRADNVTVKRSLVRGRDPGRTNLSLVSVFGTTKNFTITDSTLKPDVRSPMLDGLKGRRFTATRLDISGTVDTALVFGDNVTIQDSWFHDTTYFTPFPQQPDDQTHNDNLQIEGGTDIRVTGNTFEGAHNAAIQITQNFARANDIVIEDNRLSGGGCTVNLADKGKGPINVALVDNRFGASRLGCAIVSSGTTKPILSDNTFLTTGAPVTISPS